jgi:alpha-ketoglutarate-dependent taurine dioxygenase
LTEYGVAELRWSTDDLPALGAALGRVVSDRILTARSPHGTSDNSLSGRYGLGALPPHTDGAATAHPPRWVILACDDASTAPTLTFDAAALLARDAARDLERAWVVDPGGGRARFYAAPSMVRAGRRWLRFNADCMMPATPAAARASAALSALEARTHHWGRRRVLVIDNARVLHARAAVDPGRPRTVRRLQVVER